MCLLYSEITTMVVYDRSECIPTGRYSLYGVLLTTILKTFMYLFDLVATIKTFALRIRCRILLNPF